MSPQTSAPAAPTQETPPAVERRAAVRYPLLRRCLVRPEAASGTGDWNGIAYNLSTTGIGLTLPCPLRAGTVLVIEPWGPGAPPALRARVVRSHPVAFTWFHGCELANPLGDEGLQDWLK